MANKYIKTGYTVDCANPECHNKVYVKKGTYEKSKYKLFTCCRKCKNHPEVVKKRTERFEEIHGYRNPFELDEIKEKVKKTNLEKYGAENPFASTEIKEKIKQINLERHGVDSPMKNKEIRDKAHKTRIEKYGEENLQGIAPRKKLEETCMERYGATQFFASKKGHMTEENLKITYGYNDDEVKKIQKSKAVTLETLQNKWGEEEGKIRYENWKDSVKQTKENFIKRWGKEEGEKLWEDHIKTKFANNRVSKISLQLFDVLRPLCEDVCFYGDKEWFIYDEQNDRVYFYDFKYKEKIIEFNGDYWHGNPQIYNENDQIIGTPVKDKWEYDKIKTKTAEDKGFSVLTIWENDFRNNPEEVLEKCKEFLEIT